MTPLTEVAGGNCSTASAQPQGRPGQLVRISHLDHAVPAPRDKVPQLLAGMQPIDGALMIGSVLAGVAQGPQVPPHCVQPPSAVAQHNDIGQQRYVGQGLPYPAGLADRGQMLLSATTTVMLVMWLRGFPYPAEWRLSAVVSDLKACGPKQTAAAANLGPDSAAIQAAASVELKKS